AAAADEDVEQTKAKLQAVRKQLEELRQQEQALLKQLEQATREAAQRKEPYIKAKVKGILRHEGVYFPIPTLNSGRAGGTVLDDQRRRHQVGPPLRGQEGVPGAGESP